MPKRMRLTESQKYELSQAKGAKRRAMLRYVRTDGLGFRHQPGIGLESKALDVEINQAADVTGAITPLNLIRTGSGFNNRIGRRISLKSVYLRSELAPAGAGVNANMVRLIIFYDGQTNGALPVMSDLLQDVDQANAATTTANSHLNLNNRDRFKVIMDKCIYFPAVAANVITGFPVPDSRQCTVSQYRKLKGLEVQYKADSAPAVVGDLSTGGLFFLTLGTGSAGSGTSVVGSIRLRFVDA